MLAFELAVFKGDAPGVPIGKQRPKFADKRAPEENSESLK
jgi:hypothetical protein